MNNENKSVSFQASSLYFISPHVRVVHYRIMKVSKATQLKGHTKSHKWKDVRGKRLRPPISSSDLNSSPVMARVIKEHQTSVKKKPTVKRLKNKAKTVSDSKKSTSQSGFNKSYTQANGSSAFTMDNDSDDSQDWKEYSQSIHGNGVDTSGDVEDARPGRLDGEALRYSAERGSRHNHVVLVMQKDQVCFRIFW